jgi:hypothetical protein
VLQWNLTNKQTLGDKVRNNTESNVSVLGDLGGQEIKLGISDSALLHIMDILTGLYKDEELACIREYATNAWDSHVEAGVSKPIEVTLPGPFGGQFSVRDYGVGLSVDDLEKIYSQYGESTKRDTDEQTGNLGFGCKSALAYQPMFTLRSVKNGVKVQATVSRNEDGTASIKVTDTRAIDEPNGVEVVIPTKASNNFGRKAKQFFSFWPKGTVLIDGREPDRIDGQWVTDDMVMTSGLYTDYIVMGNVPYPLDSNKKISSKIPYGKSVVAFVPMGSVVFTPSREALKDVELTRKTIATVSQRFDAELVKAANKAVAESKTHYDAFLAAAEWSKTLSHVTFRYKGIAVPRSFDTQVPGKLDELPVLYQPNGYYRNKLTKVRRVEVNAVSNACFITGHRPEKMSASQRRRVEHWQDLNDTTYANIYFVDKPFGLPWLAEIPVYDWADIKAIKMPKSVSQAPRGGFKVWNGRYFELQQELEQDDFVFFSPADEREFDASTIQRVFPDHVVLALPKNRWNKFVRENSAKNVVDAIDDVKDQIVNALSNEDRIKLSRSGSDAEIAKRFDVARLDDPNLVEFINIAKDEKLSKNAENFLAFNSLCRKIGVETGVEKSNRFDDYPLLRKSLGYYDRPDDAMYEYINAVYAARVASATGKDV